MTASNAPRGNPLRELLASDRPALAVLVDDRLPDGELDSLRRGGLDVAELRIDRFSSTATVPVVDAVQRFGGVPTVATIRTVADGGRWAGTDEERAALFHAVLPHVSGVDLELTSIGPLRTVVDEARAQDRVLIVSHHDFDATPDVDELRRMAHEAKGHGADVVKLAAMARSQHDLRRLAAFTIEHADLGLITIAMGDAGAASRIFFPALGSRLTYASTSDPVAGQLPFEETAALLRRFYPADREVLEGA